MLYGSWRPLDIIEIMLGGVETCSTVENLIQITLSVWGCWFVKQCAEHLMFSSLFWFTSPDFNCQSDVPCCSHTHASTSTRRCDQKYRVFLYSAVQDGGTQLGLRSNQCSLVTGGCWRCEVEWVPVPARRCQE